MNTKFLRTTVDRGLEGTELEKEFLAKKLDYRINIVRRSMTTVVWKCTSKWMERFCEGH